MEPFTVIELERPGIVRRLLGGRIRSNVFIEIENLLAASTPAELTAVPVITLLSEYEVPREEAMPHLVALYEKGLRHAMLDTSLSTEERESLKQLRSVLDVDDHAATDVEMTLLRDVYRTALQKALDDASLSSVEKERLDAIAANLRIPELVRREIHEQEIRAVIQEAFNRATADRRLTADEEQHLAAMSDNLGMTITHDTESRRLVERFKLLAQIDSGVFPVIQPAVLLHRGESCYAEFPCRLHEKRTVTKRVNYSGPSGRIRIMKGLSWRYGSVSVSRVTSEELRPLDAGVLYVTSKRLLFNGSAKNMQLPFKKIIAFTLFKDGVQIEKESGRDQFFLGDGDLELLGEILDSALRIGR